jgi:hypothetical protein
MKCDGREGVGEADSLRLGDQEIRGAWMTGGILNRFLREGNEFLIVL